MEKLRSSHRLYYAFAHSWKTLSGALKRRLVLHAHITDSEVRGYINNEECYSLLEILF